MRLMKCAKLRFTHTQAYSSSMKAAHIVARCDDVCVSLSTCVVQFELLSSFLANILYNKSYLAIYLRFIVWCGFQIYLIHLISSISRYESRFSSAQFRLLISSLSCYMSIAYKFWSTIEFNWIGLDLGLERKIDQVLPLSDLAWMFWFHTSLKQSISSSIALLTIFYIEFLATELLFFAPNQAASLYICECICVYVRLFSLDVHDHLKPLNYDPSDKKAPCTCSIHTHTHTHRSKATILCRFEAISDTMPLNLAIKFMLCA